METWFCLKNNPIVLGKKIIIEISLKYKIAIVI